MLVKIKRNEVFFEKLELNTVASKRRKNKRIRICEKNLRFIYILKKTVWKRQSLILTYWKYVAATYFQKMKFPLLE